MVQFANFPNNYRLPGTFFEISPRNPRPSSSVNRMCLVGGYHNTASTISNVVKGTATDKQPVLVTSASEADTLFGTNSVLAHEYRIARANAPFSQIYVYPIETGNSAVAASSSPTITLFSGFVNFTGNLVVQVNGVNYNIPISINNNGTDDQKAEAIGNAITSYFSNITDFPVLVTNSGRDVHFTARNAGFIGNQFTIAINDSGVTGFRMNTVAFSGGTGDIFTAGWDDGLNEQPFDTIVMPSYYDDVLSSSSPDGMNDINDRVDGRWATTGNEAGLFGHVWTAIKGSSSDIVTAINARNEPHESIIGLEATNPTPEFVAAAAYAATAHRSLTAHAARPFTGLEVNTIYPPALNSARFNRSARNSLLLAGVSTIEYVNEQSTIERAVTTDADQPTWRQAQIPYTLMVVLRRYQAWVSDNYQRSLLIDEVPAVDSPNNAPVAVGSRVVTPKIVRGDFIALYRQLASELLVENIAGFSANLIVERDTQEPSKLTSNLPLDLANGLIQFPILVDFTA